MHLSKDLKLNMEQKWPYCSLKSISLISLSPWSSYAPLDVLYMLLCALFYVLCYFEILCVTSLSQHLPS